jgi:hypothetical protein
MESLIGNSGFKLSSLLPSQLRDSQVLRYGNNVAGFVEDFAIFIFSFASLCILTAHVGEYI